MDCLTVLSDARAAGLTVLAEGERLVIRGPRKTDALAKQLLEVKAELMALLRRQLFDACEVQGRAENGPFGKVSFPVVPAAATDRQADVQPAFDEPSEFGMPDLKAVPTGQNDPEGDEGTPGQHFLESVNHACKLPPPESRCNREAEVRQESANCAKLDTLKTRAHVHVREGTLASIEASGKAAESPLAPIGASGRAAEELPDHWRERVVQRRSGPVRIIERIDPPQEFPWLSDIDFDELPEPWR